VSEALQRSGGVVGAGDNVASDLDLPHADGSFDVDDGLSDDVVDPSQPIILPDPDLSSLTEIDNAVRLANSTATSRDNLARFVIAKDYIRKLVPLVEVAEDLESLNDLHKLCTIVRTLILLNDHTILDHVVTDELFMGVVGALECKIKIPFYQDSANLLLDDPDFPNHKANHRHYLSAASRFKEVVKIDDVEVQKKIHYTYRLQYLKDVVLARILDDGTFTALNSLIYFHQMHILNFVQTNMPFLKELFGLFANTSVDLQKKKDALHFIQNCCIIGKGLQAGARQTLYQSLIPAGLYSVIAFSLRQPDARTRVAGTDILGAVLEHDPSLLRTQISRAITEEKSKPLTDVLIDLLLVEADLGVQSQIADSIKVLLDPIATPQQSMDPGARNLDFLAKLRSSASLNHSDAMLQKYHDEASKRLFKPLKDLEKRERMDNLAIQEVMLFSHLLEILSYFVRQYALRNRLFLLSDHLAPRIAQLLSCPEKHLKLSVLKYFRICIGLHEQFHNRQFMTHRLFEPILNVLFETMPRDNLLNSACLELFEFIKRENLKDLTVHLVETYREKLEQITYINSFRELIEKYEKFIAPSADNLSFTSVETEQTPSRHNPNGGQTRWHDLKQVDDDDDSYLHNQHEDDEDESQFSSVLKPVANGASPIKPLVDYTDDDDDIDILTEEAPTARPLQSSDPAPAVRHETPTPPERVVEKRRREEDEEDELSKLSSQPKRRSSTSSTVNVPTSNGNTPPVRQLRRKQSMSSGKDGTKTQQKISIALAVKSGNDSGDGE
jgi:protein phosphatase-4 regulatory subunit 3